MDKHRLDLPQLWGGAFLNDGGMETTLIFHEGVGLPHFAPALEAGSTWAARIGGVKANASTRSHAELDESETLDAGDPGDLGRRYQALRRSFPTMRILGGCCGTDHRHLAAICEVCL